MREISSFITETSKRPGRSSVPNAVPKAPRADPTESKIDLKALKVNLTASKVDPEAVTLVGQLEEVRSGLGLTYAQLADRISNDMNKEVKVRVGDVIILFLPQFCVCD